MSSLRQTTHQLVNNFTIYKAGEGINLGVK